MRLGKGRRLLNNPVFFSSRESSEGFIFSCTLSNSVLVDPIKEPNKTLSRKKNNNIYGAIAEPVFHKVAELGKWQVFL